MIGEAWVDLRGVIRPGGGQDDFWQQLSYKGKYAGDIRIELTYYDTREKPTEKKDSHEKDSVQGFEASPRGLNGGPRQLGPREIRRRPLPSSPATAVSTPPNTLPTPPQLPPKLPLEHQEINAVHAPVPIRPQRQEHQPEQQYEMYDEPSHEPYADMHEHMHDQASQPYPDPAQQQPWQYPLGRQFHDFPESPESYNYSSFDSVQDIHGSDPFSMRQTSSPTPYEFSTYPNEGEIWEGDQPTQMHMQSEPSTPYSSPPAVRPLPFSAGSDPQVTTSRQQNMFNTTPQKPSRYRDSPLRQTLSQEDDGAAFDEISAPQAPPPPPKHRETPPRRPRSEYPPSSFMPQPLRIGAKRSSVQDRSPLQSIEDSFDTQSILPDLPPQPAHRNSSYDIYSNHQDSPQNQVESYNQRRRSFNAQDTMSSPHEVVQTPPNQTPRKNSYEISYSSHRNHVPTEPQPVTTSDRHSQPRSDGGIQSQRLIHRRPVSPNPSHASFRRSVGESPYPEPDDRRLSGVPFGPDAYNVLNPGSSPATNGSTRFETPEQARASERVRVDERTGELAPIIGDDGRVIDPSDHLPADTWAPEPEKKNKNKKPEHVVHIRSKNDARNSASNRSSPVVIRHGGSPASSPLTSAPPSNGNVRNRLQKPMSARPLPSQPYQQPPPPQPQPQMQAYSSPHVSSPLAESPSQVGYQRNSYQNRDNGSGLVRPSPSEYQVPIGNAYRPRGNSHNSLHEMQTTPTKGPSYPTGQPNYDRHSYYGGMNAYNNNNAAVGFGGYDDPLAAEMSLIDIGPSRGGGRTALRSGRGY